MTPAERAAKRQGARLPLSAYTAEELVREYRKAKPCDCRRSEIIRYAVTTGGETLESIQRELSR
jgi:hypothetical protein